MSHTQYRMYLSLQDVFKVYSQRSITDIRMRLHFAQGLSAKLDLSLLFHDGLNSPTRRVTHILLNQTNTQQKHVDDFKYINRDARSQRTDNTYYEPMSLDTHDPVHHLL